MESENKLEKPTLCVSCNQFYGNKTMENMCSKCFK